MPLPCARRVALQPTDANVGAFARDVRGLPPEAARRVWGDVIARAHTAPLAALPYARALRAEGALVGHFPAAAPPPRLDLTTVSPSKQLHASTAAFMAVPISCLDVGCDKPKATFAAGPGEMAGFLRSLACRCQQATCVCATPRIAPAAMQQLGALQTALAAPGANPAAVVQAHFQHY